MVTGDFNFEVNVLVVCLCDARPAGSCVTSDKQMIKVKLGLHIKWQIKLVGMDQSIILSLNSA
jgi:hypothetical protein